MVGIFKHLFYRTGPLSVGGNDATDLLSGGIYQVEVEAATMKGMYLQLGTRMRFGAMFFTGFLTAGLFIIILAILNCLVVRR